MEREALKLALEALEESKTNNDSMEFHERKNKAIAAIQEALAQPAQEPVAWLWKDMRGQDIVSLFEPRLDSVPLYTALPKRTEPAQEQWNNALDEAASRIGEIKGFGKATQDSFAIYIRGLKR